MSAVNSIYHIVINTYRREMTIHDEERIVNYINRQREHHKEQTFEQVYKEMIDRSGLEWNDYRLT